MFAGGRLCSTFQYPNTASAYFGMGYLALLEAALREEGKEWPRFLVSFLAFLALSGTFFTYSRGEMLILGLVVLLLLFLLPQRIRVELFSGALTKAFPSSILLPLLGHFLHAPRPVPFFGITIARVPIAVFLRGLVAPLERRVAGCG
jgi:hypothetical protein